MNLDYLIFGTIGLFAGILGGLLGIGGSILTIPALTFVFGPAQHTYQGAAMIVNFFVALPATFLHRRAGATLRPVVRLMIPGAVVGVVAGVWLSSGAWFAGSNELRLAAAFGGFLFYVAIYNVYRLISGRHVPDIDADVALGIPQWRIAIVGFPMGLVGGLLGIGGGAVAVPLQQVVLRMPIRRAIANSATTILPLSLLGAVYKNYTNTQAGLALSNSLTLAVCLVPTAIIGGFIGARLTHVLPRRILTVAIVALMAYSGIAMIRRAIRPAATTSPASLGAPQVDEEREAAVEIEPGTVVIDPLVARARLAHQRC